MVGPTTLLSARCQSVFCEREFQGEGEAMLNGVRWFVKGEEGASAAEYAVLLVVIALGIVGALTLLDTNISTAIINAAGMVLVGS